MSAAPARRHRGDPTLLAAAAGWAPATRKRLEAAPELRPAPAEADAGSSAPLPVCGVIVEDAPQLVESAFDEDGRFAEFG